MIDTVIIQSRDRFCEEKKKKRKLANMAEQRFVERLAEGARAELEDRKRVLRGGVICEEFLVASSFYYEYKSVEKVGERSM